MTSDRLSFSSVEIDKNYSLALLEKFVSQVVTCRAVIKGCNL